MALDVLNVQFRGQMYTVPYDATQTLGDLAQYLTMATGVSKETIKLLPTDKSGKALIPLASPSLPLTKAGINKQSRLVLFGSTASEVQSVKAARELPGLAGFEHEIKREMRRRRVASDAAPGPIGPYTFQSFQTWDEPGLHPPPAEAMKLLKKLASDRGIVGIMSKHKWTVGLLAEMPPQGKVGISPMCILGYNTNQGQSIHLRLRTDDLKGFRNYQRIRETLCHELAHNVWSEHDINFKKLNSQLLRECEEIDSVRGSRLVGFEVHQATVDPDWVDEDDVMAATSKSSGQTLGQLSGLAEAALVEPNPRAAAAKAAMIRLGHESGTTIVDITQQDTDDADADGHYDPETEAAEQAMRRLGSISEADGMQDKGHDQSDSHQHHEDTAAQPLDAALRPGEQHHVHTPPGNDPCSSCGACHEDAGDLHPPMPSVENTSQPIEYVSQATVAADITETGTQSGQYTAVRKTHAMGRVDGMDVDLDNGATPGHPSLPQNNVQHLLQGSSTTSQALHLTDGHMTRPLASGHTPHDDTTASTDAAGHIPKTTDNGQADSCTSMEPLSSNSRSPGQQQHPPENCPTPHLPPAAASSATSASSHLQEHPHSPGSNLCDTPLVDPITVLGLDPSDPSLAQFQRIETALQTILVNSSQTDAVGVLQTLVTILDNALNAGSEGKFKRIRQRNGAFYNKAGRFPGAVELLQAAGFAREGAGEQDPVLVLRRNDPGLVWLTLSAVQQSLSAIQTQAEVNSVK